MKSILGCYGDPKAKCEALQQKLAQRGTKGFLSEAEGECLYAYAASTARKGPVLEIGSYCGKSTVYLATACAEVGAVCFAVDHHRGSEEHQLGEQYHDKGLYDAQASRVNTFPPFVDTLEAFQLMDTVIPVVASSELAARAWQTPLAMAFVDGGHSEAAARHDVLQWGAQILPGGVLAVHDIYLTPEAGGQAPFNALLALLSAQPFYLERKVGSLVMLRRV